MLKTTAWTTQEVWSYPGPPGYNQPESQGTHCVSWVSHRGEYVSH